MKSKVYKVEYYDEEEDKWHTQSLDMCHGDQLCPECRKDPDHRDICDYFWTQLADEKLVKTMEDSLHSQGKITRITSFEGEEE